ncbi:RNA polymerase sigma factor [Telmatocola sphagniphila]|uniref:RNA polymerase sigma factor n=1 Tax=Telmatocola sphagniphila TaxID=1123043 RepID=A0A8E6EW25_9BACT|nr:RNA polymerase sigma factor [Telmatocola sphagniphila]QVL33535.1 RNA polymerase sigma factor [Telmatocola sphagniphila]
MLSDADKRRFETWVRNVSPRAIVYARSLLQDQNQAEDVVQECLYRLLRRSEHYDLENDGMKLLFTSISNLCINQTTRKKYLLSLDGIKSGDDQPVALADRTALPPEVIVQYQETQTRIRDALLQLHPMQRAAVELRALGMSKEEIASTLEISATNAGVLVYRARKALLERLPDLFAKDSNESL